MDMLSLCRKRYPTSSAETKRRSPRIAEKQTNSNARTAAMNRQSSNEKCLSANIDSSPAVSEIHNGCIVLKILVKTGAKQNGVTDVTDGYIGVEVSAPAREGQANIELVNYLASVLELKKSNISVEKGLRSRIKSVLVSKNGLTVDKVRELIGQQLSNTTSE